MRSRLPVLRSRRRYLVFELEAECKIHSRELIDEIQSSQISLLGDIGVACNRLKLILFNGHFGILLCNYAHTQESRAILASIYSINHARVALYVRGTSGTIKSATEKYIPQLSKLSGENGGRRIELEEISGRIVHAQGREIDLCPDDRSKTKGSDTRYMGLTSFDLCGGRDDADGTSDGL